MIDVFYNLKKKFVQVYFNYLTVDGTYTSLLPDKVYLKKLYKKRMGIELDLRNPKTFTEKLNWLKLYDRKPEYTIMVDKYASPNFVKAKIKLEGYNCSNFGLNFVPLLGVYNNVEEIDFDSLPNQFVLKCNHDNGVIICKDKSKLNVEMVKKELQCHLQRDYYKKCREWPYKNVNRKIICECFMQNTNGEKLVDYKVFCFNGIPKLIMINSNRFSSSGIKTDIYDIEWHHLDIKDGHYPTAGDIFIKPDYFTKMMELAQILAKNTIFLRVDFNVWNNNIYFGELTFFHSAGFESFQPLEWNKKLGSWLQLPQNRIIRRAYR